ncbi:PAS domain S-box protein [Sorangium sp. So ce1389]|uniref:PAS domain S-box protein n=1 Tax=Sorangium sp. So ce1389 TaxID=3133336 RepID=UPI003F61D9CB
MIPLLREHQPALGDALLLGLRERLPMYRAIPEEELRPRAHKFVELFIDALHSHSDEQILAVARANLERRIQRVLNVDDAVQLTAALRRVFLEFLRPALEKGVKDAVGVLFLAEAIYEKLDRVTMRFYVEKLEATHAALVESEDRHRSLVELSPDGVAVLREGRIAYVNPTGARMLGAQPGDLAGASLVDRLVPGQREAAGARLLAAEQGRTPVERFEAALARPDGERVPVELLGTPVPFEGGHAVQIVFRDIAERRQAEAIRELSLLQEQTIRAQEHALRALSTPLIPLGDGVVVVPLIGAIDDVRADHIRSVLLNGIVIHDARVAILDVTGVPSVDQRVAEALLGAAKAARLLDVRVIFSGIKPRAAQAFVETGARFCGVVTKATLKDGLACALQGAWERG